MSITTSSSFKDDPPNEFPVPDLLDDDYIMFLLYLEHTYSSQFELPFLAGSHNFGIVDTTTYAFWYTHYMVMLHDWKQHPERFASDYTSANRTCQLWTRMYVDSILEVFTKHKLCVHAPTRITSTNRYGETMFRYARASFKDNERVRTIIMEATVRVKLSYHSDDILRHFQEHESFIKGEARYMYEDHEHSYKKYCANRLQQLLSKQEAEAVKQQVKETEENLLGRLIACGLLRSDTDKLVVDGLKQAIRGIKAFSVRYASLRVSVNRPGLMAHLECVLQPYMSGDMYYVYTP